MVVDGNWMACLASYLPDLSDNFRQHLESISNMLHVSREKLRSSRSGSHPIGFGYFRFFMPRRSLRALNARFSIASSITARSLFLSDL